MKRIYGALFLLASTGSAEIQVKYDPNVAVIALASEAFMNPSQKIGEGLRALLHFFEGKGKTPELYEMADAVRGASAPLCLKGRDFKEVFARARQEMDASLTSERRDDLKMWRKRLQRAVDSRDFKKRLQRCANFLGYEGVIASEVFLFPALNPHLAMAFYAGRDTIFLAQMPLSVYEKKFVYEHLAVLLHEICHQWTHPFAEAWRIKGRENAGYAYLEEALAVCLGNRLLGDPETEAQTAEAEGAMQESIIDTYSVLILPLVRRYLAENRRLDDAFVQEAVALFAQHFPHIQDDYPVLMFSNANIVSDFSDSALCSVVLKHFFTEAINVQPVGAVTQEASKKRPTLRTSPTSAPIYVVHNKTEIPGITLKKQSDYLWVRKVNGRVQVIIQTDDLAKVDEAFAYLQKEHSYSRNFVLNLTAKPTQVEEY